MHMLVRGEATLSGGHGRSPKRVHSQPRNTDPAGQGRAEAGQVPHPGRPAGQVRAASRQGPGESRTRGVPAESSERLLPPSHYSRFKARAAVQGNQGRPGLRLRHVLMDCRSGARARPSAPAPRGPGGCCRRGRRCLRRLIGNCRAPPTKVLPRPGNVGVAGSSFPIDRRLEG